VDCSEDSLKIVRKNIEKTGFQLASKVIRSEYGEFIKSASKRGQKFDYVFADPPYDKDLTDELIKRILRAELVKPGGLLMVEGANEELQEDKIPESVMNTIESIKKYKFSKCFVYFVRVKGEAEA
jgi:16S rRNA G966 N2-methylase RsmD